MGYVAVTTLKWGDGWIAPGDSVPADEPGRNYALLLHSGEIQYVPDTAQPEGAERPAFPPAAWGPDPEPEPPVEADDAAKAEGEDAPESSPYEGLKQKELKAELDARGIEYKKGPVRNAALIELLEADDAAKADEQG